MYSFKNLIIQTVLVQMVVVIQAGVYSTDDQWVFVDRTKDLPEEAVLGGYDPEGYYNYVGRVSYVSNVLPARVVPELGRATSNTVGTNALNDRVFICRVRCDEAVFIGTLYLAKRTCIVKYENLPTRQFDKYEILVRERHAATFSPFVDGYIGH